MIPFRQSAIRTYAFTITLLIFGLLFTSACNSDQEQAKSQNEQTTTEQQDTAQLTDQNFRDASLQGQTSEVRKAIDQGIDVNASDEAGRTALMLASFNGNTDIVQLLLDEGANISARNAEGRTPLIFAASGPFPDTVELLLESGANPNTVDQVDGWSALMFAAAEGHQEVVQTLLDYDADPSLEDKDGETALNFAQNNDHTKVASLLEK